MRPLPHWWLGLLLFFLPLALLPTAMPRGASLGHFHYTSITDTRWPENDENDPAFEEDWILADSVGSQPLEAWVVYTGADDDVTITDATQTYDDATGDAAAQGVFDAPLIENILALETTAFVEFELTQLDDLPGKTLELGFTDLVNRVRWEESEEKLSTNVISSTADVLGIPRIKDFSTLPVRIQIYYHFADKIFTFVFIDDVGNTLSESLVVPESEDPFLNFFPDVQGTDPDNVIIYFYVLFESAGTVNMLDWGTLECRTVDEAVDHENCGADLEIDQTNGVSSVKPGQSLTYEITASNLGGFDDDAVHVVDHFPSSLDCTWTCSGDPGVTCSPGPITGDIDEVISLPASAAANYVATCTLDLLAQGILTNVATVSGTRRPDAIENNSSTDADVIVPATDLAIALSNKQVATVPGENTIYSLISTNFGPIPVVDATLTASFSSAASCEWECYGVNGATCTGVGIGDISDTLSLPVGGTASYFATCQIDPGATGALLNIASISTPDGVVDPLPANNAGLDSDLLTPKVDLRISKSDGVDLAEPGEELNYTIAVDNLGPSDAMASTVTDLVPPELTNCSWICSAEVGALCTGGPIAGDLVDSVDLPVGTWVSYDLTCTVDPEASFDALLNQATVEPAWGVTETDSSNNVAIDKNFSASLLFADGFESGNVSVWSVP